MDTHVPDTGRTEEPTKGIGGREEKEIGVNEMIRRWEEGGKGERVCKEESEDQVKEKGEKEKQRMEHQKARKNHQGVSLRLYGETDNHPG